MYRANTQAKSTASLTVIGLMFTSFLAIVYGWLSLMSLLQMSRLIKGIKS